MFGIFWNNKKQNDYNNNKNNNEILSSSPSNSYDIESASYLHGKNKIENKIQVEQYKHDLKEESESESESIEIKNTCALNKSVFPIVPPIRIIKSSNLARPYSSSTNSSPINTSKIIKQNQTIIHSLSTNNLDTLDNIHNDSVLIKVELDEEDEEIKKEHTELKLYNETLEKINKLKEEESNEKDEEENFNVDTEAFADYILKDSVRPYNDNSYYCQFLWSGIEHLDHWELQRKLNRDHAKTILSHMKKDYKKKNKFIFYDVIHLGIKSDGNYYVIDGQHRLVAYYNLYLKNLYPIQKVPAVIWETTSDDEFLEIYERINKRVPFDVTPFNKKILDIIFQMDNHFGNSNTIWGKNRPKIDKTLFISEMDTNDSVHKLDADTIMKKIIDINIKIRGLPRSKRTDIKIQNSTHASAESIDFFLGYDKNLSWIHEISI